MKKLSALLFFFIFLSIGAYAQNCYTGPNNITPGNYSNPGFTPTTENLPCAVIGQQITDTIYFTNYTDVTLQGNTVSIDSLTIDSIGNLPAGTCWTTNKATNTFAAGENGVIYIHGFNTAAPGQYSLNISISFSINGIGNIGPVNASQLGVYYWIRAICSGTSCPPLDTVNGKTQTYIAYTACSSAPVATISPSGQG